MDEFCRWIAAYSSSCAEVIGFVTGALNVWLVTRENIWSWPVGLVNASFYAVVFMRTGLYSDTGLQVVYFVLSLYGWWHWWRGGPDRAPVVVTRVPLRLWFTLALITTAAWFVLSSITKRIPGAAMPHLDAALVSVSLVAMWMMTRKLLENWILWIVVDMIYIGLFINRGLRLTAVLYTVFLALALLGFFKWKRSADQETISTSPALS